MSESPESRWARLLEYAGVHDKPRCGQPYEVFTQRLGLVTITCHKPLGHPVDDDTWSGHSGGREGIACSWGPDDTQSDCAIAYRQGLADGRTVRAVDLDAGERLTAARDELAKTVFAMDRRGLHVNRLWSDLDGRQRGPYLRTADALLPVVDRIANERAAADAAHDDLMPRPGTDGAS